MGFKYCGKCGTKLNEDSAFCKECGYKIENINDSNAVVEENAVEKKPDKEFDPFKQKADANTTIYAKHDKKSGKLLGLISASLICLIFVIFMISNFTNKPKSNDKDIENSFTEDTDVNSNEEYEDDSEELVPKIHSVQGELYAGRTIDIIGEGFDRYNIDKSKVTIDGLDSTIISWGDSNITVVVPVGVKGEKEIAISNPPIYDKETIIGEFIDIPRKELTRGNINPNEDTIVEGEGIKILIPEGSLNEEKEIIVYKRENPSVSNNEFYTTLDEFEITDENNGHVFFNNPVLFGIDVESEEEAMNTTIQYFDESIGTWVKANSAYNAADGKLYILTEHFSPWRRMKNNLIKKISEGYDSAVDKGKTIIKYPYNMGKAAAKKIVELGEEAYISIKDNTVENFIGVSGKNVIVFYRESDAQNDTSISETAKKAAAAYETAYDAYAELFGIENMPNTIKLVEEKESIFEYLLGKIQTGPTSKTVEVKVKIIEDPLKVYIDPNYNAKGANYNILTGSISMPSSYPDGDLAETCAHELFHAIQHHQYGLKMLYMANGYKDVARKYLESDKEVSKYLANNKWYFEATAEFAARFIGTNVGINTLHSGTEATSPYYAFSGTKNGQEYGMSAFIDYIVTIKNSDINNRKTNFKEMWNYILDNYSTISSVNVAMDNYITENMNTNAVSLYGGFWQDIVTQASMPTIPLNKDILGSSALVGIQDFVNFKRNKSILFKPDGYGIFRIHVNEDTVTKDETSQQRSIWLELSNKDMLGSVYQLEGLDMDDRVDRDINPIGYVNGKDKVLQEVLVQYKEPDSFALVAHFKGTKRERVYLKCIETALNWDNQIEIEKKVKNTTLDFKDKLEFTPVLPTQKSGDEPFKAIVVLNNDIDFTREISNVENGKTFEVDPPMYKDSSLPPDEVTANVKIMQGDKLIHEYQSIEKEEDEIINLTIGLKEGKLEVGDKGIFEIQGIPSDINITKIIWEGKTRPKNLVKDKFETKSSELEIEFKKAMTLDLSAEVHGIDKDGKETLIGIAENDYSIKEKQKEGILSEIAGEWVPIGYYSSFDGSFKEYDHQMERIGKSIYFDGQGNMVYTHAVERAYNSQTGEYSEPVKAYTYEGSYHYDKGFECYFAEVDNSILYERFLHEVSGFSIEIREFEGKEALEINERHINNVIYIKK